MDSDRIISDQECTRERSIMDVKSDVKQKRKMILFFVWLHCFFLYFSLFVSNVINNSHIFERFAGRSPRRIK